MSGPLAALAAIAASAVIAAGCVTRDVEDAPSVAGPVSADALIIPIGNGRPTSDADRYYADIVEQMREALAARDVERLESLIASHDRENAPAWARDRMASFRDAAVGMRFEVEAARASQLLLPDQGLVIGAPMQLRFRLADVAMPAVRLGSGGVPLSFLVEIKVIDYDALGGTRERSTSRVVTPERVINLGHREAVDLPVELQIEAGAAVVRQLHFRAELLPGSLEINGRTVPVRRTEVAARRDEIYPRGVEPIREKPLLTLQRALALGDPKHFPHLYLAARFVPDAKRGEATGLLINSVRLGRPDQARAAMAALQVLTRVPLSAEDREGWLRWWQEREAKPADTGR